MDMLHSHPMNRRVKILGRKLRVGETIQEGDVYNSSSGGWEPATCVGQRIRPGNLTYWVRPSQVLEKVETVT